MKNNLRKAIALALTLIMMLSCLALTASAATAQNITFKVSSDGGYLAIGDSIGMGCGSDGGNKGQYHNYEWRGCEGAYTTTVANAVGCYIPNNDITDQTSNYWPCCYPGLTTAIMLDLLGIDDGFTDTEIDYPYYDAVLKYFGTPTSIAGTRGDKYVEGECGLCGDILEVASKAELITVELGMCDVFYRAYRIVSEGGFLADGFSFDVSKADELVGVADKAVSLLKEGYNYWKANYHLILDKLKELNPDATIVIVNSFNPIDDMTLLDDTALPLCSLFTNITDQMNKQYEAFAEEYGVLYADIANCETHGTESDWALLGAFMGDTLAGSHPSQIGHDYIARQILSVLPPVENHTNIYVDLVRFNKVDKVLVNGIPVKNYTLDGFDLNIDYSGPLATNMVIFVCNDDGTTQMQTYDLTYTMGEGYTVHRIYGNNDVEGHMLRPFNLIKKLFQMIIDKIKGLFAK